MKPQEERTSQIRDDIACETHPPAVLTATSFGLLRRFANQFPPGQMFRYILVGIFNTVFGYGVFASLNFLLYLHHVPASYIFASFVGNFISITVAYLGYKFLVFRTRGNYLKEWLKAMAVYTSSLLPALVLLPITVRGFIYILPQAVAVHSHVFPRDELAPYLANAFLMVFGVIYNFIGHKNVTFRNEWSN
jgi:putative flippase GtrA